MQHNDAQESLADGIDTASLPPMGPDGAPALEPLRETPPEAPRLCQAGPCRHYHTFKIQLDAQNPMNVTAHGRVFHTEQHHYCYPTTGVETNLGSLPVLECNRWTPVARLFRTKGMVKRRFERELQDFAAQSVDAGLNVEAVEIPDELKLRFTIAGPAVPGHERAQRDAGGEIYAELAIDALNHAPLGNIVCAALVATGLDMAGDGSGDPVGLTWTVADDGGAPYDNLSATPAQLGLSPGARLIVTLTPKENV